MIRVIVWLLLLGGVPGSVYAALVRGGGSRRTDCVVVLDASGANQPASPREPRHVDCIDGDTSCDADASRNGECSFTVSLCINSTTVELCTPFETDSVEIAHAVDNGDRRFDPDFQALQQRVALLGLPGNGTRDACTFPTTLTVRLRGPRRGDLMRKARKRLQLTSLGRVEDGRPAQDRDTLKLTCRPEGDGVYRPRDLYSGSFDRIARQIFAPRCAVSGCHDSESQQAGLELLPTAAYSAIVGVAPTNGFAASDGLLRITPGDPGASLLYRKVADDLLAGYGSRMPLGDPRLRGDLVRLMELWILGDATLGPAPETGWVPGTD